MEQVFPLTQLPHDMQCEILSYPMSLEQLLTFGQSKELLPVLENCVEVIKPDQGEEGELLSKEVLPLKRIKIIYPNYPIIITSLEQLIALAKKKSLRKASFDVTNLKDYSFYSAIISFFRNYNTLDNTCKYCQPNDPRYSFVFFYRENDDLRVIEVSEGGIFLINIKESIPRKFFSTLSQKVPICEYRGPIDLLLGLSKLSCLSKIYLKADQEFFNISRTSFFLDFNMKFLSNPNITEYYLSYPKDNISPEKYNHLIINATLSASTYPHIIRFFPTVLTSYLIRKLNNILPNLTSISIIISSINSLRQPLAIYIINDLAIILQQYPEIILVIDTEDFRGEEYYRNLFPNNLQGRISFIDSDWLA